MDTRRGVMNVSELEGKAFKPLKWIIPGVLPVEGVAMLVAPSKTGKSLFALNLIIDVALKRNILKTLPPTTRLKTLYLDLENSERRAYDRVNKIIHSARFPHAIDVALDWDRIGDGCMERLEYYLTEHTVQILVVDVLGKVQPIRSKASYQSDQQDIQVFKQLATAHKMLVLLIHHTRKAPSDDWVDMVSGSNALAGTCDTIMLLDRKRQETDATLYVTGRDVGEDQYRLQFDKSHNRWEWLGVKDEGELSDAKQSVMVLLRGSEEPLSPKDIATMLNKSHGYMRRLVANMEKDGLVIREARGQYVDRINR